MNRVVFVSLAILFLLSISSITGLIQVVKADGAPIYINADGSITPSTASIYTADNITYTLTGNITNSDGIVIERDNIVLNGAGYTVTGNGNFNGITLGGMGNVTVGNMTTTKFFEGIVLRNSSNCTLSGNNVTANSANGIELDSSSNSTLSGNNVTANNIDGIYLGFSSKNTLSGNVMVDNEANFDISGSALSDFLQSVDTSNLVDGKPVYYFVNQSDIVVNADAYPEVGYLGFVNCLNVTVQGMNLTNNGQGLLLAFTNNSEITDNNAANTYDGIELDSSSDNTLSGNNATNSAYGIWLGSSSNNVLSGNNVTANEWGIYLQSSSGNTLSGNNAANNQYGIGLNPSSNNVLSGNTITANTYGGIYLSSSSNDTLSGNNVAANKDYADGIVLFSSSNDTLCGNNVTANNDGGIDLEFSFNNTLSGNSVTANNVDGIWLYSSFENTLSGNVMAGNENNFGVICPDYNDLLLEFLQSIDTSNLVNGKPVYYFVNQSNIMVNPDAYPEVGYLGFVNCVNVTVQGMNLTNNSQGLLLAFTNDSEITGNNASNNYYGFYLYSTFNCTLSGNDVTASDEFGIELDFSSNNTIYHNDFINNTSQVYSSDSTNVWDNGSVGNYWSDYLTKYPNATQIDNSGVWNTPYVIDANNTDYYPLMQPWVPYEGGTITINADGSITPSTAPIYSSDNITYTLTGNITITNISNPNGIVVDRDNIVLDGAGYTVTGSGASNGFLLSVGNGITLDNMSNVTINNMMITNFTNGIYLHYSSNNTLSGNNLTNNYNGVNLELSSSNTLSGNNITANNESGIVLGYSDNNLLSSNNVTTNDIGVYLETSSGNTLSGNNITANNDSGVWLDFSSNNFIFRNNFMNNTIQVTTNGLANIWDNGSTGNYWSDYLTKYPSATETNGIWNTPYVIDSNNTDYYPLAVPMMETVVPEFPSFLILPLFLIATLLAVIIYKKKGRENKPKLDKT